MSKAMMLRTVGAGARAQGPSNRLRRSLAALVVAGAITAVPLGSVAGATPRPVTSERQLLASGLLGATGSTVGPDGALYVTEGAVGRITRIDPETGAKTTFAEGLPEARIPVGGVIDVVFVRRTAYALVTLVGSDLFPGSEDVVGIYRIDGPHSSTVIADIGQFSIENPSAIFDIPTGFQYAIEEFRGGFLVTDGHHNRVLRVTLDGDVSELIAFGNNVPTGLEVSGNKVYMGAAGPVPHRPADGKVLAFRPMSPIARDVAAGAPLIVDVERGRGRTLYALSQGDFPGGPPGAPASPNTGGLVKVNRDGTFTTLVDGLDRPTSLEFIGNTAFIVTLTGDVVKISNVSNPPYGRAQ